MKRALLIPLLVAAAACSDGGGSAATTAPSTSAAPSSTAAPEPSDTTSTPTGAAVTFTAEVWADNWFSLYVNGELVGEDSVPITTERSFNAETITFTATYPLTIAMVTKDFKEDDSGLEYIGTDRQQMGDGGFIAQITDTTTGEVVAVTGSDWRGLVVHRAPLNSECASSADPATACEHEITAEPADWAMPSFDDSAWATATVYTADEVGAKEGYTTITWAPAAALIWGSDLKLDNTILWRTTVVTP